MSTAANRLRRRREAATQRGALLEERVRRGGGEPMASQMVMSFMRSQTSGPGGCIGGARSETSLGAEDDGPLGVFVRNVKAFAFKLVHGEVSAIDGGVFPGDAQDAVVVGSPGSV
eukprot:6437685-Heterocapsa_arctica.AAC.1